MNKMINPLRNEQGQIMVIALVILVLLTLIGISITTTSDIDIQIAKNEQQYVKAFYVADSAWRQGVEWLDSQSAKPSLINTGLFLGGATGDSLNVRNYGGGENGVLNNDFQDGTQDGTLGVGASRINYWYSIRYLNEQAISGTPASSISGAARVALSGFSLHDFVITASAGPQNPGVTVTVSKLYPEEGTY
jgi:Tfp pilus assembly protein PilX